MAIYAIGDVQGCFDELQALLKQIDFLRAKWTKPGASSICAD